ncbi:hypothetical protein VNI00_010109 [Paramarasmius palmivorus]|uniref:Uncharacterized protein n=1 Tax=Paramarasmius palmivorus TaxID=297713 RepID=A0AAW0CMG6_9AGAR
MTRSSLGSGLVGTSRIYISATGTPDTGNLSSSALPSIALFDPSTITEASVTPTLNPPISTDIDTTPTFTLQVFDPPQTATETSAASGTFSIFNPPISTVSIALILRNALKSDKIPPSSDNEAVTTPDIPSSQSKNTTPDNSLTRTQSEDLPPSTLRGSNPTTPARAAPETTSSSPAQSPSNSAPHNFPRRWTVISLIISSIVARTII